jgi:hypothetical protein
MTTGGPGPAKKVNMMKPLPGFPFLAAPAATASLAAPVSAQLKVNEDGGTVCLYRFSLRCGTAEARQALSGAGKMPAPLHIRMKTGI